jgi:hypothetical protein|tara:strand:+ start:827 stop:1414 length:588 start_codon:yes stop_codon:yes gene_type:complete
MACIALTKGRGLSCDRSSGGVKYIYFGVYDKFTSPIETAGVIVVDSEVTDINMVALAELYRYTPPRGSSQAMETITGSTDNGTIFYTPTVSMVLNRLSKEDQNEIKLLGQTQVIIFAQLNEQLANGHDVIIALGVTNAMQMNAGTADSGTAFADRNGYTLNFDGFEANPFPMVADYTADPFDNAAFDIPGGVVTS